MNLMIVEDEARLRLSLAGAIPWEEHGIEVVALASNGKEALQLFERKKPDILLLDVQMPEMDGLTLVRLLRERDAFLKTIILSGHDNFAYAQQAMESGVTQYLLKPAGERDILEAVAGAARELRQELDRRYNEELLRQKWIDHLPQLRAAFFERLLRGSFRPGEAQRQGAEYGLTLPEGARYAVAVVDAEPAGETLGTGAGGTRTDGARTDGVGTDDAKSDDAKADGAKADGEALGGGDRARPVDPARARFSVYLLAQALLSDADCWPFLDGQGYLAIIFTVAPDTDAQQGLLGLQALVDKLLNRAREGLGLVCSAGIGGSAEPLGELNRLYAEACLALQDRIVYGPGIAIPYREPDTCGAIATALPPLSGDQEKALEIALELGDAEAAGRALEEMWLGGLEEADTADEIMEGVLYIASQLVRFVQKQGLAIKEVLGDHYASFLNPSQLTTRDKIRAWLESSTAEIAAYQARRRKSSRHQFVETLLRIAQEEIDQEVTLHTAAERLFVNPSYLSRLFKQEMGQTFSAYVLELKMEKAKAALSDGAKVYDAARMVGYRDVSYFTKVFRKYWGVTPGGMKP
ncbi:hypothetical protein J19TS2_28220 [Cohnella xylanilytica]|nr:hypothetical protein J19TS2_28220 [Cohnella xylanilytica]